MYTMYYLKFQVQVDTHNQFPFEKKKKKKKEYVKETCIYLETDWILIRQAYPVRIMDMYLHVGTYIEYPNIRVKSKSKACIMQKATRMYWYILSLWAS